MINTDDIKQIEKFLRGHKSLNNQYYELFINPTKQELYSIDSMKSALQGVRALLEVNTDNLYVWDGDSEFHINVLKNDLGVNTRNITNHIPLEIYKDKSVFITGTANLITDNKFKSEFKKIIANSKSLKTLLSYL